MFKDQVIFSSSPWLETGHFNKGCLRLLHNCYFCKKYLLLTGNEQNYTQMARDLIHYHVRRALEKEGWQITNDPYFLRLSGKTNMELDLQAEKIIAAQKGKEKIFIEIKSFARRSILYTFYEALGQYLCYRDALKEAKINLPVFLAIPLLAHKKMKKIPFILRRIQQYKIQLIIIDTVNEKIEVWKK